MAALFQRLFKSNCEARPSCDPHPENFQMLKPSLETVHLASAVTSRRGFLQAGASMAMLSSLETVPELGMRRTQLSIEGGGFLINGRPTYEGRSFRGWKMEGLLMNSRMANGIFDDLNGATRDMWKYPNINVWDP